MASLDGGKDTTLHAAIRREMTADGELMSSVIFCRMVVRTGEFPKEFNRRGCWVRAAICAVLGIADQTLDASHAEAFLAALDPTTLSAYLRYDEEQAASGDRQRNNDLRRQRLARGASAGELAPVPNPATVVGTLFDDGTWEKEKGI